MQYRLRAELGILCNPVCDPELTRDCRGGSGRIPGMFRPAALCFRGAAVPDL